MEQRQPVLHAGEAAALAHRLVEKVVARRRAELGDIALAEAADGLARELEFGDRHEVERVQLVGRTLRFRIEAADRFERVAEEIEADRIVDARRIEVEYAAAHRVFARLADGGSAQIAVELEPAHDAVHGDAVAGARRQGLTRNEAARRRTLHRCVDRREQHRRLIVALQMGEPRQRGHAFGDDARMRRNPVVGLAVPGGEFEHGEAGSEEGDRARELRQALSIAADDDEAHRGGPRPSCNSTREIGEDEPFRPVGDARDRQRPAGTQQLGRRTRLVSQLCRHQALPLPRG